MTKCPTCDRQTYKVRSIIRRGVILEGCAICLTEQLQQGHEGAARYNREWQKKEYRRDLLQPGEAGFVKEYPKQASELFDDDYIRRNY